MNDVPQTSATPTWDLHAKPFDVIENRHAEANRERDALLRKHGWTATCDTPGSYWMWEKAMPDGRILLVTSETAFRISRYDAVQMVDPAEIED